MRSWRRPTPRWSVDAPGASTDAGERLVAFRGRLRAGDAPRFLGLADGPGHSRCRSGPRAGRRGGRLASRGSCPGGPVQPVRLPATSTRAPPIELDARDRVERARRRTSSTWCRISIPHGRSATTRSLWKMNRIDRASALRPGILISATNGARGASPARSPHGWTPNPPKLGSTGRGLDGPLRAISWVWALHLFVDAPALTPALHARMLDFLHVHARHLNVLLDVLQPNTRLTGEALGLVFHRVYMRRDFQRRALARDRRAESCASRPTARCVRTACTSSSASQCQRYTTVLTCSSDAAADDGGRRSARGHAPRRRRPADDAPSTSRATNGAISRCSATTTVADCVPTTTPHAGRRPRLLATGRACSTSPTLRSISPDAAPVSQLLGPDGLARLGAMPPAAPQRPRAPSRRAASTRCTTTGPKPPDRRDRRLRLPARRVQLRTPTPSVWR